MSDERDEVISRNAAIETLGKVRIRDVRQDGESLVLLSDVVGRILRLEPLALPPRPSSPRKQGDRQLYSVDDMYELVAEMVADGWISGHGPKPQERLTWLRDSLDALRSPRPSSGATPEPYLEVVLGEWHRRIRDVVFYARVKCREMGYALSVHGSLHRDVDLIAVPWTDQAVPQDELAQAVNDYLVKVGVAYGFAGVARKGEDKPLGRKAWTIALCGDPTIILDLSVAPLFRAVSAEGGK